MAEIKEEELKEVSGGYGGMMSGYPYPCQITNIYWGNTFMTAGPYDALIGQYMQVIWNPGAQGPCKYQLVSGTTYMGWTIEGHFRLV